MFRTKKSSHRGSARGDGADQNVGFTLIELLIVVAIIGLLATLMMPNLLGSQDKAREAGVKAVMHSFQTALESYNIDNLTYPAGTDLAVSALFLTLNTAGYMTTAPVNPFTGSAYTASDAAGKIFYTLDTSTGRYTLTGYKRNGSTVLLTLQNS